LSERVPIIDGFNRLSDAMTGAIVIDSLPTGGDVVVIVKDYVPADGKLGVESVKSIHR